MNADYIKTPKRSYKPKKHGKGKQTSGRKCRICGKDPYPNYFFCRSCHHNIDCTFEDSSPPACQM